MEEYDSNNNVDNYVRNFSKKLKEICEVAIQGNYLIEAIGD